MKEPHWLDQPNTVRWIWRAFLMVLAVTVLAEALVQLHSRFALESLFGFHAWFGLISCAAMIVIAKALGLLLKRPDSFYAEDERDD